MALMVQRTLHFSIGSLSLRITAAVLQAVLERHTTTLATGKAVSFRPKERSFLRAAIVPLVVVAQQEQHRGVDLMAATGRPFPVALDK